MKIVISLSKRVIDSLIAYGKVILGFFDASRIENIESVNVYQTTKKSYTKMVDGYMKVRKNIHTEKLSSLETSRAKTFRMIKNMILAYRLSENNAEAEAAKLLLKIFDQYGLEFLSSSYLKVTAKMSSFIADISTPECQQAFATLSMEAKVTRLVNLQQEFEDYYNLNIEDMSIRNEIECASEARTEFEEAMRMLLRYVELKQLEGDAEWNELAVKIATFNTTFEQRETQRQAKPEEEPEEKPEVNNQE